MQEEALPRGALQEFPVPLVPTKLTDPWLFLRVPGSWSNATARDSCLAIVPSAEGCGRAAFPRPAGESNCSSVALVEESLPFSGFLGFKVPRPDFAVGLGLGGASGHAVCLAGGERWPAVVGLLRYYSTPRVGLVDAYQSVGVRTFLNPGWHHNVTVNCTGCSDASRLTLQPILMKNCKSPMQQALAAASAAARVGELPHEFGTLSTAYEEAALGNLRGLVLNGDHASSRKVFDYTAPCQIPEVGPCQGYVDYALSVGVPAGFSEGAAAVHFTFDSSDRLAASRRQEIFRHRAAICFYPDDSVPHGWLVGFATLRMHEPDVQAFVIFVCFFGVALPLICMVTAMLHVNKLEHLKKHVQQVRLEVQRGQLRQEVGSAPGGAGGVRAASREQRSAPASAPARAQRGPRSSSSRPDGGRRAERGSLAGFAAAEARSARYARSSSLGAEFSPVTVRLLSALEDQHRFL